MVFISERQENITQLGSLQRTVNLLPAGCENFSKTRNIGGICFLLFFFFTIQKFSACTALPEEVKSLLLINHVFRILRR